MTDSPEQQLPRHRPTDIVEEDGTVIAVEGDVQLEIDGMGQWQDNHEPGPGGDDRPGQEDSAGGEDSGDG